MLRETPIKEDIGYTTNTIEFDEELDGLMNIITSHYQDNPTT